MDIICESLEALPMVAQEVIKRANNHRIWLFEGAMGAGKTTLIKEICKQMGVKEVVHSPTFSLVNEYQANHTIIYHFDFYRIQSEEEVMDMGYEDYFYDENSLCFLEWASLIPHLLPEKYIQINIQIDTNQYRHLQLKEYE